MSTFTRNVHPYNERGEAGYLDPLGIYRRGQRAAGALRYARDVITAPVQTVIPHFPKYLVEFQNLMLSGIHKVHLLRDLNQLHS